MAKVTVVLDIIDAESICEGYAAAKEIPENKEVNLTEAVTSTIEGMIYMMAHQELKVESIKVEE